MDVILIDGWYMNEKICAILWYCYAPYRAMDDMWVFSGNFDGDMLCAIHWSGGPHG